MTVGQLYQEIKSLTHLVGVFRDAAKQFILQTVLTFHIPIFASKISTSMILDGLFCTSHDPEESFRPIGI